MIRFGLCCQFFREPIKFYSPTAASLTKLRKKDRLKRLAGICQKNAESLQAALHYCAENGIGCFRVNSRVLPLKTHPEVGYTVKELPDGEDLIREFQKCRTILNDKRLRATFHPDQFILLSSPDDGVTKASVAALIYQAEVCEWIGADVINIHGGGAYGDKEGALRRLVRNFNRLPQIVKTRLTLENDDRTYTPGDLLPICETIRIPLVYDVHHHRCLPDSLSVEDATDRAIATWNREPLFHLSSPKDGWRGAGRSRHHDFIDPKDFPECWKKLSLTVEVEAKAKEAAIKKLKDALWPKGAATPQKSV